MRWRRAGALAVMAASAVAAGAVLPAAAAPAEDVPCVLDPETGGCLSDRDRDGRGDTVDNCPDAYNPGQEDNDGDGLGNACDPTPNGAPPPPPAGGGGGGGGTPAGGCDGGAGVYLYEHVDYGGRCKKLTSDSPNYETWPFGNQAVSSVRIVGDYAVTLFDYRDYKGDSTVLTRSSPDPFGWVTGEPWAVGNDDATSARVARHPDPDWSVEGASEAPAAEMATMAEAWSQGQAAGYSGSYSATASCRRGRWARWRGLPRLFRRTVYQTVYWCWEAGAITYHTGQSDADVDGICRKVDGPMLSVQSGGRGWSGVVYRVKAAFTCPTPWPWFQLTDSLWVDVRYAVGGTFTAIGRDP